MNIQAVGTVIGPSERVAETLTLAFQDDPALAWIFPDPVARKRIFPGFFRIMIQQSQRCEGVLASQSHNAAALLYSAGPVKDGGLWENLRLLMMIKTGLPRALTMAKAIEAHHPDPQSHLYLRYLGVAPSAQGQGMGGAAIRAVIARASQQQKHVLLETANENNVSLYSRFAFEIIAEWNVPDGGPRFWTMVRTAD